MKLCVPLPFLGRGCRCVGIVVFQNQLSLGVGMVGHFEIEIDT